MNHADPDRSPGSDVSRSSAGVSRMDATMNSIESSVTRLLVATKQLLESLTSWAKGGVSEQDVSDVYVNLGNEFNIVCRAFMNANINVDDLGDVPQELRDVLERALSEEALQKNLDIHLPTIRDIIVRLLTGLKQKQSILRSKAPSLQGSPRVNQMSRKGAVKSNIPSSGLEAPATPPTQHHQPLPQKPQYQSGHPASYRHDQSSRVPTPLATDENINPSSLQSSGGVRRSTSPAINRKDNLIQYPSKNFSPGIANDKARRVYSDNANTQFNSHNNHNTNPYIKHRSPSESYANSNTNIDAAPIAAKIAQPTIDESSVLACDPLAALQHGEALERRASRRFSAYHFAKLAGSSSGKNVPDMPSLPIQRGSSISSMSSINGNKLPTRATHSSAKAESTYISSSPTSPESSSLVRSSTMQPRISSPLAETFDSEITTIPKAHQAPEFNAATITASETAAAINSKEDTAFPIFIQYDDRVKKIYITRSDMSLSSLRLRFMEKFAFVHTTDTFPDICIKDPATGIEYDLDEINFGDIKSGVLLILRSINLAENDFDNTHADDSEDKNTSTDTLLAQKEITEKNTEKLETLVATVESLTSAVSSQKDDIQKLLGLVMATKDDTSASSAVTTLATALINSTPSSPPTPITPLKALPDSVSQGYLDQIANLRQELAVIRQVTNSSMTGLKTSLTDISEQAKNSQATPLSNLPPKPDPTHPSTSNLVSSRTIMEACHGKLSNDTDTLLTKVDDLQDVIEALRKDVAQRGVRPLPRQLEVVAKDLARANNELKKMDNYISTEKPGWKKTWERELETICDEQQFFKLQEELVADLQDDLRKAGETFKLIEQCSMEQSKHLESTSQTPTLRKPSATLTAAIFSKSTPSENLSEAKDAVLSEVLALRPNHQSRLEAIEKAEKLRKLELENRVDKFEKELGEFVGEKKLKKSGGVEEAERRRQVRDEQIRREQMGNTNVSTAISSAMSSVDSLPIESKKPSTTDEEVPEAEDTVTNSVSNVTQEQAIRETEAIIN
ncbi:AIP3-domain-containing protein [Nadsonia fulvescens var. elongata DSM 6958]|uniref:AIP3-domain-containing protein n=1 Tax=Nadsonia fulvescens var. elongata DSM 6958 TaxID=857566 RepID=A0A1E3PNH9_9ASCO|nr:AIP3-domain-containing protein [Nadsonia fulvescens var. elongata DSM 6958]